MMRSDRPRLPRCAAFEAMAAMAVLTAGSSRSWRRLRLSGGLLCLAALAGSGAAAGAGPAETLQEAWGKTVTLSPNEALVLFDKVRAESAPGSATGREAALGAGVALLDVQPRTVRGIERAASLFGELAAANPDDAAGLEARFLLARIDEIHRDPADPAAAEREYRALIHDHPESIPAQFAAGKLAILCLYVTAAPADVPVRFAELEALAPRLTDPAAAVDFHLAMGAAALDLGLPDQKAFDHLAEADRLGVSVFRARADNLVRLGSLAVSLGRPALGARYWGEFVRDFVHDNRNYAIRQKLAALEKGAR